MAVARDAAPVALSDAQHVAVLQAHETRGHGGHQAAVVVGALADGGQSLRVGEALRGVVRRHRLPADGHAAARRHARDGIVGGAHPQQAIPARGEPVRQPDVVWVHVRDDHAQHRQAAQLRGEHLLPRCAGRRGVDAAIHNRPAAHAVEGVFQQPEVDVVQRERQPHAQPAQPRRQLDAFSQCGRRFSKGVADGIKGGLGGHGGRIQKVGSVMAQTTLDVNVNWRRV